MHATRASLNPSLMNNSTGALALFHGDTMSDILLIPKNGTEPSHLPWWMRVELSIADLMPLPSAIRRVKRLEICNVVLRLLAVSVVRSVVIDEYSRLDDELINAPTLAYLWSSARV
jgi:hypothetical protein